MCSTADRAAAVRLPTADSLERRLGELLRRKTLPFNGYADQVSSLYSGMDLRKFY